jgi:signal peptidase II
VLLRCSLFLLIAVGGAAADLWTKSVVFAWRGMPGQQPVYWLLPGYAGIETALNTGALFGLGQDRAWLFSTFSVLALLGILSWLSWTGCSSEIWLLVTMACVTGGIAGNLYDRLGLWHHPPIHAVRDWIRLSYHHFVWPNFNVADALLVCGAILLVWHSLRGPGEAKQQRPTDTPPG